MIQYTCASPVYHYINVFHCTVLYCTVQHSLCLHYALLMEIFMVIFAYIYYNNMYMPRCCKTSSNLYFYQLACAMLQVDFGTDSVASNKNRLQLLFYWCGAHCSLTASKCTFCLLVNHMQPQFKLKLCFDKVLLTYRLLLDDCTFTLSIQPII